MTITEPEKFIAHWETLGKDHNGWIANPEEWEPVERPLLPRWDDPDRSKLKHNARQKEPV